MAEQPTDVLVAFDGSAAAALAFPLARIVAQQIDARLGVLYVSPCPEAGLVVRARLRISEEIAIMQRVGDAAHEILAVATDPQVRLVIMTTHGGEQEARRAGRSCFSKLGRVAAKVVAQIQRPLLLVRPEAASSDPGPFHRLLLPLDGTPTTARALQTIAPLLHDLGAALDLLYIVDPEQSAPLEEGCFTMPRYLDQAHHEWSAWRERHLQRVCTWSTIDPAVLPLQLIAVPGMRRYHGRVSDILLDWTKQRHPDGMVVVRRSALEPGRARVLQSLFATACCPLFIIGIP